MDVGNTGDMEEYVTAGLISITVLAKTGQLGRNQADPVQMVVGIFHHVFVRTESRLPLLINVDGVISPSIVPAKMVLPLAFQSYLKPEIWNCITFHLICLNTLCCC